MIDLAVSIEVVLNSLHQLHEVLKLIYANSKICANKNLWKPKGVASLCFQEPMSLILSVVDTSEFVLFWNMLQVDSKMLREIFEKVVGVDDSTFSEFALATLIMNKYGRSYMYSWLKRYVP